MGYNISGIVIDKNYSNTIDQLKTLLGENLVFNKELTFEEASENWKEDDYCDIYFSKDATLIFVSMARAADGLKVPQQKTLSFILSEMTMTFAINYTENGEVIRNFAQTEDGERHEEIGTPLSFEKSEEDVSELIYYLLERTLGKRFWDIDLEETCFRYYFKETISKTNEIEAPKKEVLEVSKPWWKFW